MSEKNCFDHTLMAGYLDNVGSMVVEKMLALYIQQSAIYIDEIQQALNGQSQEMWQDRCHKMKGAASSVGLSSVHAYLVSIEKSLDSWAEKEKYLEELTAINVEGIDYFKAWLAQNS